MVSLYSDVLLYRRPLIQAPLYALCIEGAHATWTPCILERRNYVMLEPRNDVILGHPLNKLLLLCVSVRLQRGNINRSKWAQIWTFANPWQIYEFQNCRRIVCTRVTIEVCSKRCWTHLYWHFGVWIHIQTTFFSLNYNVWPTKVPIEVCSKPFRTDFNQYLGVS